LIGVLIITLGLGLGCGQEPEVVLDPTALRSDPGAYKAMPQQRPPKLRSGAYGVVKLTSEHRFEGEETASYVAQGAGTLIVSGGDWSIVTARHVVVPNTNVKEIDGVTLGPLQGVGSRVAVSSLGIEPTAIRYSTEHDVALLAIAPKDHARLHAIANLDPAAPIPLTLKKGAVQAGRSVEAWGYPAKHLPQLRKPAVTTTQDTYFVLNEALQRGFSGGPVFVGSGRGKAFGGIIIRADEGDEQTIVLNWSLAETLLNDGPAEEVAMNGETKMGDVPFAFRPTLPTAPVTGD
jgi:hypothetical protein